MSVFWKQTLEAAGWTALQVFLLTFAASYESLGALQWDALPPLLMSAALAAGGAALSIIKSNVLRKVSGSDVTLLTARKGE